MTSDLVNLFSAILTHVISCASFIEIPPVTEEIASREIGVNGRTADRTTGKHDALLVGGGN